MSVHILIPLCLQLFPNVLSDSEYIVLKGVYISEDMMIDPLEDILDTLHAIRALNCNTESIINMTIPKRLYANYFTLDRECIQDRLIVFCHNVKFRDTRWGIR